MRRLLFVCTHNSARSILAEGLANHLGDTRLRGFSAGSHPSGHVNPLALDVLREQGCSIDSLHSKSWDVFVASRAEPLDAVITVCDNAAHEPCPVWPGTLARVHWGLPDPSRVEGDATVQINVFRNTAASLIRRLRRVLSLPLDQLDPPALQRELQHIHDVVSREERHEWASSAKSNPARPPGSCAPCMVNSNASAARSPTSSRSTACARPRCVRTSGCTWTSCSLPAASRADSAN